MQQYEIGQLTLLDVLTVENKWIASRIAEMDVAGQRLVNIDLGGLCFRAILKTNYLSSLGDIYEV